MPIVSRSSQPARPPAHRRSPALALALVLGLAVLAVPVQAANPAAAKPAPSGLGEFMGSLATVESGGRYDARNPTSGAYGKYQIMPSNWPAWAQRYLGNRNAKPTPRNQERVAAGKLTDLHGRLRAWDRVAYWWLTGKRGPASTWSAFATRYVNNVMVGFRLRVNSPGPGATRVFDDSAPSVRYAGTWRVARHRSYVNDAAHYSTAPGAAVGLRFTGRTVRIEGPRGPTRGRVAVFVDGTQVTVVDLFSRSFRPRTVLFTKRWASRGEHHVELRVLRTPGRQVVAVDRVVVRG